MARWSLSRLYKALLALVLAVCVATFVAGTWHWPLVGDAAALHYIVFLLHHGRAPYRNIVDMNMPGAYFVEDAVMRAMGGGSLSWRIFDLLLGAGATLCMAAIAWPRDRFAGFLAGAMFLLLHGRDGIIEMGQRDLTMTVLVLAGYAVLFSAGRTERPQQRVWATGLSGVLLGCAATVKPTVVLIFPPLLALFLLELRRRGQPRRSHLLAACAGFAVPPLLALGYVIRERAVAAFLDVLFRLIPANTDLYRRPFGYLAAHAVASCLPALILLWLPVGLFGRLKRNWENWALALGIAFGLVSFFAQAKGYPYHQYPAEAFLLLVVCIDLCAAVSADKAAAPRWVRPLAPIALAGWVAIAGVDSTHKALEFDWRDEQFDQMLVGDLTELGGPALQGRVQCMDMAAGCLKALYQMRLVQATGLLFDCHVLRADPRSGLYRQQFREEIRSAPPAVFVVTSSACDNGPRSYTYRQLGGWPEFDAWLKANYTLEASRIPTEPMHRTGHSAPPFGYRVYVRNGFRGGAVGGEMAGTAAGPRS